MTNLDRALVSKYLARVRNNLSNVINTLLWVCNIQTFLARPKSALIS